MGAFSFLLSRCLGGGVRGRLPSWGRPLLLLLLLACDDPALLTPRDPDAGPARTFAAALPTATSIPACPDPPERPCYDGDPTTQGVGECKAGVSLCRLGVWGACTRQRLPAPRQCGADHDCDGQLDALPPRPCYGSWPWDGRIDPPEVLGECRHGYTACSGVREVCVGAVYPSAKQCGNAGRDHDCDGKADTDQPVRVDVVLEVDNSGSMSGRIAYVVAALLRFLALAGDSGVEVALVLVPGAVDGRCERRVPLSIPSALLPEVAALDATGGGTEPTWDCPYEVATGELGIAWRPGARRVSVLVTDEPGHSERGRSENDAALALRAAGIEHVTFTEAQDTGTRATYDALGAVYAMHLVDLVLPALVLQGVCR